MIGKKIMALFVLAIFAFSLPVFAAGNEDAAGAGNENRAQHGKDIDIINAVKTKSVDSNDRFKEARDAVKGRRAEAQVCKNSDTAECEATLREYAQHQAQYLKAVRDRMHTNLDLIEHFAENYIDDSDERAQVLDHAKDLRQEITTIYANIDNVETVEDAKAIRDRLAEKFKTIRDAIHQYNAVTRRAKLHSINQKMINLNTKFNHVIDGLEIKGINLGEDYPAKVAVLNEALANAQENLDLARDLYQQAMDLKNSGGSQEEVQALIEQSRNYADKGRDYLKDVKNHLKDIINSVRLNAGNEEFSEAVAQTA